MLESFSDQNLLSTYLSMSLKLQKRTEVNNRAKDYDNKDFTRILGRNQDFYECDENTFVITNKNSTDKTRILYIKQELDSDNKNPLSKSGF